MIIFILWVVLFEVIYFNVEDVLFDCCTGKIEAFVVPVSGKFCGLFGNESEFVIPFECVKKIGPDIILVEICEEKFLKSCKD